MNYIRTKLTMTNIIKLNNYFIVGGVFPTAIGTGIYTAYTTNNDTFIKSLLGVGSFSIVMGAGFVWPITLPIAIAAYVSSPKDNRSIFYR